LAAVLSVVMACAVPLPTLAAATVALTLLMVALFPGLPVG
jgi:hypothetical protein